MYLIVVNQIVDLKLMSASTVRTFCRDLSEQENYHWGFLLLFAVKNFFFACDSAGERGSHDWCMIP